MDYIKLIDKYYADAPELRHILVTHSRQVADRALQIIDAHPEWTEQGLVDRQFVEEAAMLHDIGIIFATPRRSTATAHINTLSTAFWAQNYCVRKAIRSMPW